MSARVPAIAAIIACIAALLLLDARTDRDAAASEGLVTTLMPVSSSADSLGSTWYCPGAMIDPTDDGVNTTSTLVITNPTDDTALGAIALFPASAPDGGTSVVPDAFSLPISVSAGAQSRVDLREVLIANGSAAAAETEAGNPAARVFVAALAEFSTPGVIVEHRQRSEVGVDAGSCASAASPTWYFAAGTTTTGVTEYAAILNPFPTNAVLDIVFVHDEGVRTPGPYKGLVVPAETLLVLDVGLENTVRAQSAMSIIARSGRVVVERIQEFGSEQGPRGLTLGLGGAEPALQWTFPAGRSLDGAGESYVIFNPNESEADVELLLRPDSGDDVSARPFPFVVAAGERVVITIDKTSTHPTDDRVADYSDRAPDGGYWALIQSFNDTPVIAERVVTGPGVSPPGVLMALGAPLASESQWLALPVELGASAPLVAVVNPASDTLAQVTLTALVGEDRVVITEIEIGPGERIVADLATSLPVGAVAVLLESSAPVVAEVVVQTGRGAISSVGVPSVDSVAAPRLILGY